MSAAGLYFLFNHRLDEDSTLFIAPEVLILSRRQLACRRGKALG